jgi:hypothetical protein
MAGMNLMTAEISRLILADSSSTIRSAPFYSAHCKYLFHAWTVSFCSSAAGDRSVEARTRKAKAAALTANRAIACADPLKRGISLPGRFRRTGFGGRAKLGGALDAFAIVLQLQQHGIPPLIEKLMRFLVCLRIVFVQHDEFCHA